MMAGVVAGPRLRAVVRGLDHPEGVAWDPDAEVLYAGGEAGQVYRATLDGALETLATVPGGLMLGIALDAAGRAYVCDAGNGRVQRVDPDGRVEPYGPALGFPNSPAFAPDGSLYVSDSGGWDGFDGGIVRIDPDGAAERLELPPLAFANGLAIRGEHLYTVESQRPGVVRIPLAGGPPEPVVELERCVPDGLAFDRDGGLLISCWQPNRVYRLGPDGALQTIVDDWTGEYVLTPTNTAFAGDGLATLVLAGLAGWQLTAIDPDVPGAPLQRPVLP
jgi:sugar lactone lactonase YvrE